MKPSNMLVSQSVFEQTNPAYHAYTLQMMKRRRETEPENSDRYYDF